MAKTCRLDARLLELGLVPSRQVAQAAIMDGAVLVNGNKVSKPGAPVSQKDTVELLRGWGAPRYVSRGGVKLEKALSEFHIDPMNRVCLDIGASTGGFTDCLLKHGAAQVYAIDVGYGQLDWALRSDERVIVKERINARFLTPEQLYGAQSRFADLAVIDVSFISLSKIMPAIVNLLASPKDLVCLIKPQFEAGRQQVGKGGVVKSPEVHVQVVESLIATNESLGLHAVNLTYSPIKGPAGNIEYLAFFSQSDIKDLPVDRIVQEAHRVLNSGG